MLTENRAHGMVLCFKHDGHGRYCCNTGRVIVIEQEILCVLIFKD